MARNISYHSSCMMSDCLRLSSAIAHLSHGVAICALLCCERCQNAMQNMLFCEPIWHVLQARCVSVANHRFLYGGMFAIVAIYIRIFTVSRFPAKAFDGLPRWHSHGSWLVAGQGLFSLPLRREKEKGTTHRVPCPLGCLLVFVPPAMRLSQPLQASDSNLTDLTTT